MLDIDIHRRVIVCVLFADKGEIWEGVQDMHAAVYSVQMVSRSEDEI